jgi:diguanylate cyclase (GGDEF)-like protein
MEVDVAPLRRSLVRGRRLVNATAVLTIAALIAALLAIWHLRVDAVKEANDEIHRLGVVLAEQTTRTLQTVDVVLRQIEQDIRVSGATDAASLREAFGGKDVTEALQKRLTDLPQIESFAIVGSDGNPVNVTGAGTAMAASLPDRSYFRHFAATPDPGVVVTDPIVNPATGATVVPMMRGLRSRDGTFLGVLTASIRLAYFDAFFNAVKFGAGMGVTIAKTDGTILAHFPETTLIGARLPPELPFYHKVAAGGGQYISGGVIDSRGRRFVSVHPLTEFPLVVDITRLEWNALAHWRRQALEIGGGVLCTTLCLALLLFGLSRQFAVIDASRERVKRQSDALRESEARLAEQSATLRTTLDHMNQGLIMVDKEGIVAVCNNRAGELLDIPPELMNSRPRFADLIDFQYRQDEFSVPGEPAPPKSAMHLVVEHEMTYERRRPNGTVLEVRSVPLAGGGMVRTFTDITARAAAQELLSHAATHGQLTGLANRAALTERFEQALAAARRDGGELAVLCLDLDRFKLVNDTLGHAAGDRLLALAAQRMRNALRHGDLLARMGGDEFAVLLVDPGGAAAIEQVAQRILTTVAMPYVLDGQQARIGVSIGIAVHAGDEATAEQMLRDADMALYQAKATGRNTWRFFASADCARARARGELESDLRAAIEQEQLTLAYQPICATATRLPVAFEALLRWNHPRRGAVSPAEFIPLAEASGLILPLGRWVIETACAQAATWAIPVRVAVNLSPAQFREHGLIAFIGDVLARTGLEPSRLELEVTEGLLLENNRDVAEAMHGLRAMGIRMVLDDFGTAHSSLSYLRDFPFDQVKIDGSFIRALNSDRQAGALVETMLAMARALGINVVVEGVETEEQLALLRKLRCELVQGYLLGHPDGGEVARDLLWRRATQRGDAFERAFG